MSQYHRGESNAGPACSSSAVKKQETDWHWCHCLRFHPFHTQSCLFLLNQISECLASSQSEHPTEVRQEDVHRHYQEDEDLVWPSTPVLEEPDSEHEDSCHFQHGREEEESEEKQRR